MNSKYIYRDLDDAFGKRRILFTENMTGFPQSNENPLYQTFKTQVLADEAQLEDADGNLMTAEDAKAFVATLP